MPETELKFEVAAGDLKRLARHPAFKPKAVRTRLRSSYFDTPEFTLRDAGLNLRVRNAEGRHIQTVKASNGRGLFDRDEWEADVGGEHPDLEALAHTPAGQRLNGQAGRLQPLFVTSIERGVRLWTQGEAVVEIAVDRGQIKAGKARQPVLELELELKSGPEEALYALASELAELAPLRLSFASKSDRGYRLAAGQAGAAVKAEDVAIDPDASAAEAFRRILRSCLIQLTANAEALRRRPDAEVLHQARIGLRRLRAALSIFRPLVSDEVHPWLKSQARWIAGELNAARELDVFMHDLDPADPAYGGDPSVAKLVERARTVRGEVYAHALASLESPRFAQFVFKLALWAESGPWTRVAERAALRDGPIAPFATVTLERLFKAVRKPVKAIARIDDEARHAVRIRAKKLRYASEFFAGAIPGEAKPRRRFEAAVRDLQDALGGLNDIAGARGSALRATGGSRSADLSFAAGLVVARIRRGQNKAMRAAREAGRAFEKARRFWGREAD